jgi:hypothetical protein
MGRPSDERAVDAGVLRVYEELKALLARDDLAPATRANLVEALAAVSLVVHDLALDYEMLYDLGV